jgi:hypothetical protein
MNAHMTGDNRYTNSETKKRLFMIHLDQGDAGGWQGGRQCLNKLYKLQYLQKK